MLWMFKSAQELFLYKYYLIYSFIGITVILEYWPRHLENYVNEIISMGIYLTYSISR